MKVIPRHLGRIMKPARGGVCPLSLPLHTPHSTAAAMKVAEEPRQAYNMQYFGQISCSSVGWKEIFRDTSANGRARWRRGGKQVSFSARLSVVRATRCPDRDWVNDDRRSLDEGKVGCEELTLCNFFGGGVDFCSVNMHATPFFKGERGWGKTC